MADLACPRCDGELDGDFYGPCSSCRDELRSWTRERQAWMAFCLWITSTEKLLERESETGVSA